MKLHIFIPLSLISSNFSLFSTAPCVYSPLHSNYWPGKGNDSQQQPVLPDHHLPSCPAIPSLLCPVWPAEQMKTIRWLNMRKIPLLNLTLLLESWWRVWYYCKIFPCQVWFQSAGNWSFHRFTAISVRNSTTEQQGFRCKESDTIYK